MVWGRKKGYFPYQRALFTQGSWEKSHEFWIKTRHFLSSTKPVFRHTLLIYYATLIFLTKADLHSAQNAIFAENNW